MTSETGSTDQQVTSVHFIGSIRNYPARVLAVWYLGAIGLGAAALMHPRCQAASDQPLSWLDAVFTSTSATCVTGLVVRSTGHDFSGLGQVVILLLIQVGGIGIMTLTTYVMFSMGRTANLRHRAVLSSTIGTGATVDLRRILRDTLAIMLMAESIGFVILVLRSIFAGLPVRDALWPALFHTVSAFCNAGFALPDDSLMMYQEDLTVNLTIMSLIITGGMGFPVILDLKESWQGNGAKLWERVNLHSKLMLIGTCVLLCLGTVSFLAFEWHNALDEVPFWTRPLVALFHSVTCRTAGFNTVDVAQPHQCHIAREHVADGGGSGSGIDSWRIQGLDACHPGPAHGPRCADENSSASSGIRFRGKRWSKPWSRPSCSRRSASYPSRCCWRLSSPSNRIWRAPACFSTPASRSRPRWAPWG